MIVINNIDDRYFELNGTRYAKIYQPLKQGNDSIGLYNVNDTSQQLVSSESYTNYTIDNISYNSQSETISALLSIVYLENASFNISNSFDVINNYGNSPKDGINNFRRIKIQTNGKIALIGDSITHGAFASSIKNDSYAGLLRKTFNKEFGFDSYGFETIKDDYTWTNDLFHEVIARTGDWTENFNSPYSECGYSIKSNITENFLEIKVPATTLQDRFIVKYLRNPNNTTNFNVYVNDILVRNQTRDSGFYFDFETNSSGITDSGDGFCYVKIEVVSGDVEITGMKYIVNGETLVFDSMAQSGRKASDMDTNTVVNIFSTYDFVIWALGHNDKSNTGIEQTKTLNIFDDVVTNALTYGIPVLFLDFLWKEASAHWLRQKITDLANSNNYFDVIQFPDQFLLNQSQPSTSYLTTDIGYWTDSSHPNDLGHQYLFEAVARNLDFQNRIKNSL